MTDLDVEGLPGIFLLPQDQNLGFAAANNLAAQHARGEWLILLNPDAEAAPDWLAQIRASIARHPDTAMFASTQIDMDNPDRLDGAGDNYLVFGAPWRGGFSRPLAELPDEGVCFGPCGAAAAYRMDLFHGQGGFDEDYFCFCEDVDLAFRLRLSGERCIFLPDARVHHAGGGLAGRTSRFSLYHGARNRIWTHVKNMPLALFIVTFPAFLILNAVILFRGLQTGRFRDTWDGTRDAVVGMVPVLRKRASTQARRKISNLSLASAMSWSPLRMLKRSTHVRPLERLRR